MDWTVQAAEALARAAEGSAAFVGIVAVGILIVGYLFNFVFEGRAA